MLEPEPTVFIVDDDAVICDGISQLVEDIGLNTKTFTSAQKFLDFYNYDTSCPGCLVLDVRMPGMSGLVLQDKLAKYENCLPIIFITGHGDVPTASEAFKGGAIDFLEKPFSDQVLLDSINKAIETSLKSHRHHAEIAEIQERMDSLTSRESQILDGIVDAKTNKMIALELQLSPKTVDFHRCNVMEKMGVNNTVQLVKMVMKVSGTQTSTRSK